MSKYRRLTRSDRYQIEKGLSRVKSVQRIADQLGMHRSTIYREIKRGKNLKGTSGKSKKGDYNACEAHRKFKDRNYDRRGCFYKGYKIKGWVEDQIILKLSGGWSPDQISHRLKMEKNFSISPEAIYKFILSCKHRGSEIYKYLRHYRNRRRRCRFKRRNLYWELQYQRRKSIDDRPKAANTRKQDGHWERDLMLGKRGSGALLTAVDRKTRYTLLEKLRSTFASEVNPATAKAIKRSKTACRTMTNDNGHEFGEFWELEKELNVPIYFTHPLCPWERGTVENTIGLLRQFIPKGSDLTKITKREIKALEKTINSRPRKSLGYRTPIEVITGKKQKLITQKRIAEPSPEYYEQFYLTAEEIEAKKILREKIVALTG
jgi:transposase, IS30 family